jgi:hypothetical protein
VVHAVFELLSYHSPGRTAETAVRMICFWVQSSQRVPLISSQCLMVANITAEVESNLIRPGCRSSKLLLVSTVQSLSVPDPAGSYSWNKGKGEFVSLLNSINTTS